MVQCCRAQTLKSHGLYRLMPLELELGAVLLQGEGEQQRPVAYISRKPFPRETRYSAIELECLALKWALDTFLHFSLPFGSRNGP